MAASSLQIFFLLSVNSGVLKVVLALIKGLVVICAPQLPLGLLRALLHMDQVVSRLILIAVLDVFFIGDRRADESAHLVGDQLKMINKNECPFSRILTDT